MLAALLLATLLFTEPVEVIVLRDGHRIEVSGPVRSVDGRAVFRTPAGRLHSLPLEEIDMVATQKGLAGSPSARQAPAAKAVEAEAPKRKLKVSEDEKRRLLEELSGNHSGTPSPLEKERPSEEKDDWVAKSEKEREEMERQAARWRERARAVRDREESARRTLADLQRREQEIEDTIRSLYAAGYDPNLLGGHVRALESTRAQMDAARRALEAAERARRDLEEDARKAGALPGWLRD